MNKKLIIILVIIFAIGGFAFFSENSSKNAVSTPENSAESVSTDKVAISNYDYSPSKIKVKKGTTVTWENLDLVPHTVTKAEGSTTGPDSALFGKGKTYTYTFNDLGLFNYFCKPHPYMKGVVEVVE